MELALLGTLTSSADWDIFLFQLKMTEPSRIKLNQVVLPISSVRILLGGIAETVICIGSW